MSDPLLLQKSSLTAYERIDNNPIYHKLIFYRKCLGFGLSLGLMFFYFLAFYLVAYQPHWIISPISSSSVITKGIAYCSFVIVISFVMTGIYMVLAQKMDRMITQILGEIL